MDNLPTAEKIRIVTATTLFDGHDAAINIMRRLLQSLGAEVIHLGHNRSVTEIVRTAIQEDAHAIAASSYQGGHNEFFKYLVDELKRLNASHIKIFGGGGGVITPPEILELQHYGVSRIYSPQDGQVMGLQGVIEDLLNRCAEHPALTYPEQINPNNMSSLARLLSAIENNVASETQISAWLTEAKTITHIPIIGITGTGGAGKSSLTDEIILRFRLDNPTLKIGILAIDPSRRKTGGALLGDRIRMNAIDVDSVYMRSLANRSNKGDVIPNLDAMIALLKLHQFQLIFIETPGIGQGDAGIVPLVDFALYTMTPEYGAASQLEKIDMLDFADLVAINKFDRRGGLDALRDVRKQMQRNRRAFGSPLEDMPVYGTIAARFNDTGVTGLYHALLTLMKQKNKGTWHSTLPVSKQKYSDEMSHMIPEKRHRYLAEIAETVRQYHQTVTQQVLLAQQVQHIRCTQALLPTENQATLDALLAGKSSQLSSHTQQLLQNWPDMQARYQQTEFSYTVRNKTIRIPLYFYTLAGTAIPKVALPNFLSDGDTVRWLMTENVPGEFPYTAGVFPLKRQDEDQRRLFAGEGDPFRTNKRFKLLSQDMPAVRLSTAFDSVTLYGRNPDPEPDVFGKVGNSGVSIATIEDMRALFAGFDLCDPKTSVSMTINGPAPTILAFFLNAAMDQQAAHFANTHQRQPNTTEWAEIQTRVLQTVRGTVQADIFKEDQAQNTCIFSIEFSLKMMIDIQEYFIKNQIRNFYSASISGYHIAEAGANPITQLAFTLANGFTLVETYLARGMKIDDFAPNLAFFFSNSMDAEYSVLGRVARRIWAVTLRDRYQANERSQKLKYHCQTSGRSLHAQEMSFNDIRTTLEALIAIFDNCNSLHTNAFDEAVTTPSEESVRRALAIQLIINQEWGLTKNENAMQGSFIIEQLTALVEEAVLKEFDRINVSGGVLGAMEAGYQRAKIQQESLHYESKKHDGSLPIVGVNTFLPTQAQQQPSTVELSRSSDEEKNNQLKRLQTFHQQNQTLAAEKLKNLRDAVIQQRNVFETLMDTARYCSLGQISDAFFEVGGKYRRSM